MWSVLALLLLMVPLLEIFVIIQVGQVIGAGWTIVLLIAESAVGAWIVKREGQRAWHALRAAFSSGGMPTRELADAALVLVGGALLLTPGFVTDVVGFVVVLPFTRPLTRRLLSWMAARHVARGSRRMFGGPVAPGGPQAPPSGGSASSSPGSTPGSSPGRPPGHQHGPVVPGEVVDDE